MSFLRLLTTGKSWVDVKDLGRRFQMTDPRSMPKFGSDKNPLLAKKGQGSGTADPEQASAAREGEKLSAGGGFTVSPRDPLTSPLSHLPETYGKIGDKSESGLLSP